MGAALHLAHAHQPPPGPKRKRGGGGGGGDGYDYIVAKVYRDPRQTPESRELILLLAWLSARDPDRNPQVGKPRSVWARANDILGVDFTKRRPPAWLTWWPRTPPGTRWTGTRRETRAAPAKPR